ncbi:hypothetical protein Tco_0009276 [Tanacetum coccineum]
MIASSESRNSSKNMPRLSSNGMVHNYYLEETKKRTHKRGRKSRPSVMPSARSQSTTNDCKPKLRSNTQTSSNWPASKSSCIMTEKVPIAEHSRNSRLQTFCLLDVWVPTGKIFTFSTTKVDSEPPHGSNTNITNIHECIQNLDASVGTPLNLKKERIKVWIKENLIPGRQWLHGIALIHEISARPKSQEIRCSLTS